MGLADKQMSELSCHARGLPFLFPEAHTVIDIGGPGRKGSPDRERDHDQLPDE